MIFWIALFFIEAFLLMLYAYSGSQERRKLVVSFIVVTLTYFAAFRDGLGMDYTAYQERCETDFVSNSFWLLSEPLFNSVVRFCYNTSFSAVVLFMVSSFVTVYFSLKTYIRYKEFVIAAFFFIFFPAFYLASFNVIRQFMAAAVMLWGTYYLLHDTHYPRFKYILSVIAAFFIHKSALVMLIPLFFYKKDDYNRFWLIAIIVVSYLLPVSYIFSLMPVLSLINRLDYSVYLTYASSGIDKFSMVNIYQHVLFFILVLCKKRVLELENRRLYVFVIHMFAVYLVLCNLSTGGLTITYRLSLYFSLFLPIAVTILPQIMNRRIALALIIIPTIVVMSYRLWVGDRLTVPSRILPFSSIFDAFYDPYVNPYI